MKTKRKFKQLKIYFTKNFVLGVFSFIQYKVFLIFSGRSVFWECLHEGVDRRVCRHWRFCSVTMSRLHICLPSICEASRWLSSIYFHWVTFDLRHTLQRLSKSQSLRFVQESATDEIWQSRSCSYLVFHIEANFKSFWLKCMISKWNRVL